MSALSRSRPRTIAVVLVGIVLVGVASFGLTRAVAGASADPRQDWIAAVAEPIRSFPLDPELPLDEAFGRAAAASGGEVSELAAPDQDGPTSELLEAVGALLVDPRLEASPDTVTSLVVPGVDTPRVDLSAQGYDRPGTPDPDTAGTGSSRWAEVPAGVGIVARGSGSDPEPPDDDVLADEGGGEGSDPAVFDALLAESMRTVPDERIADDGAGLLLGPASDPDFLDVCAGTIDDEPIDCGEGMGGTIAALFPPLEVVTAAIDHGPRCADLEEGPGVPVRVSFNQPPREIVLRWQGDRDRSVTEERTQVPLRAAQQFLGWGQRVYHHCQRLPRQAGANSYELHVQARGQDWGYERVRFTLPLPLTQVEGRPPTVLEPVGDRRLLARVASGRERLVAAHLVVRDPAVRGLGTQCDPQQLEGAAWQASGSYARPGAPVRIRPVQRLASAPGRAFDASFTTELIYDLAFRTSDLDAQPPVFELCLTWTRVLDGDRVVIERESHLVAPPERPVVEVLLHPSTESFFREVGADGRRVTGRAWADVRQLRAAGNGTTLGTNHLIQDVPLAETCTRSVTDVLRGELAEHVRLCRFELTDERQQVILSLPMESEGSGGREVHAADHLIRLPSHLSSRHHGDCLACGDTYTVYGWSSSRSHARGLVPAGAVRISVAVGGDPHGSWLTFPLSHEDVTPDRPVLDTVRSTITADLDDARRGIVFDYRADRPVQVRLAARPITQRDADAPVPLGCPAERLPHLVGSEQFRVGGQLRIEDACALTRYRLAVELIDEDGARTVQGDLVTWLLATRVHEDLPAAGDDYRASGWRPVHTTDGHRWEVETQIRLEVAPELTWQGDPARISRSWMETPRRRAAHSFLGSLEVRLGPAVLRAGEDAGDGRRCIDPRAEHPARTFEVEVPDEVVIGGTGHLEMWMVGGCGFHSHGNRQVATKPMRVVGAFGDDFNAPTRRYAAQELAARPTVPLVARSETLWVADRPPRTPSTPRGFEDWDIPYLYLVDGVLRITPDPRDRRS
ncbi:MAG: hypothetical protein JJT89_00695 [Nitriliruptoraceae bacterium]|nr:hypothetical protein [Nitriliruptoraceae bacterium]